MDKELERIMQRLHGEYQYAPTVSNDHKKWWLEMCLAYVRNYLWFYARFAPETVEFVLW